MTHHHALRAAAIFRQKERASDVTNCETEHFQSRGGVRKDDRVKNTMILESRFQIKTPANFARIHQTLRVTPAMEAGITDHVWSLIEIINLID